MSAHDYHEGLPGYDAAQVWPAGCAECERRGLANFAAQLGWLDPERFARALDRAREWPPNMSRAESGLLRDLRAVMWKLAEQRPVVAAGPGPLVDVLDEFFRGKAAGTAR